MPSTTPTFLADLRLRDPAVEAARQRLLEGGRLTQEEGVRLYDAPVLELGRDRKSVV